MKKTYLDKYMDYLNSDSLIYLGLIILFLGYWLWSKGKGKKSKNNLRKSSFRRRYEERKREKRSEDREEL